MPSPSNLDLADPILLCRFFDQHRQFRKFSPPEIDPIPMLNYNDNDLQT